MRFLFHIFPELVFLSRGCRRLKRDWVEPNFAYKLSTAGSAIPDGLNPLNSSQKLIAISKIAIGESNHHRLTTLAKLGKMMKTKVLAAHHAEEITPQTANALGI